MPRRKTAPDCQRPRVSKAAPRPTRQDQLLKRVRAAEQSLRAIPSRDVDALVVFGRHGAKVVTLKGGESAYRMLVEAMSEGAATVSIDGVILYCNRSFGGLTGHPPAKLISMTLHTLVHEACRGRLDEILRAARKRPVKGEFLLQTRSGNPVPVHLSFSRLHGYRGQVLGMVVTDLTDQRQKQEAEIRQAESMHRLLLERELSAQEAERSRIARELHDEAGQLLTSLLVGLRRLDDSRNLANCRSLGRRMREITAQAIDEVGRLARGLHPMALDDHGLDAALNRYVAEFSKTHDVRVQLALNGLASARLPHAVQVALYRILQETLTNVARHARARTVRVDFRHTVRALEVSVRDDGRGFDTSAAALSSASHLGLRSIRERATLLGGTATFQSGPQGTQVQVHVPLVDWEFPSLSRGSKG